MPAAPCSQVWQTSNSNQLPESIVMFRDGVSEGQFNIVMARELESIKQVRHGRQA